MRVFVEANLDMLSMFGPTKMSPRVTECQTTARHCLGFEASLSRVRSLHFAT